MRCPACHADVPSGQFCLACGASLAPATAHAVAGGVSVMPTIAVGGSGSKIYRGDFTGSVVVDVVCPQGIDASPGQWTVSIVDGHDVPTEVTLHIASDAVPGEHVVRFDATVADGTEIVSSPGEWKVTVEAVDPVGQR